MLFKILTFSWVISTSTVVFSQRLITGRCLDLNSKKPIEKVDVTIFKGTEVTSTNVHGYFQLTVENEDSLLITHRDYKTGLITIPGTDVFTILVEPHDNYPMYLNGTGNLNQYLQLNIKYPPYAISREIEGVVFLELILDANGQISDCRCIHEIGGKCGQSAIAVFKSIPGEWSKTAETKSLIFPLVYTLGFKPKSFEMPDIDFPPGKIMETIWVFSSTNF